MAAAARHLTPVILELGGKCPAIVDSNVKVEVRWVIRVLNVHFAFDYVCPSKQPHTFDMKVCARRIIAGKWAANCGQACISIDYIITVKTFAPKLVRYFHIAVCFNFSFPGSFFSRLENPKFSGRCSKSHF